MKNTITALIVLIAVIIIANVLLFTFVLGDGIQIMKPKYECDLKNESCLEIYGNNLNECKRSLFIMDFDAIEYELDIDGVSFGKCTISMKITDSPFMESIEGEEMTCKIPEEKLNNADSGDSSLGMNAFEEYCKGELKETLQSVMPNKD